MNWGDLSSYLALGALIAALGITYKFNERQKKFFETQELLNKSLLRQADAESREKRQADFGAKIVSLGESRRRLKIFNQGKAPARNVRLELLEGDALLIQSDVDSKFPAEHIDPQHGLELIVAASIGGPTKVKLRLLWEDDDSLNQEKVLTAHVI